MERHPHPPSNSKAMLWAGYIVSALPVLLLLFSAAMKLASPDVGKGFEEQGYPAHLALKIGVVELVCTLLYVFPQTAVLGAILLTGYLGGATATHVRVEDKWFFAPILVGVFLWLGLYLRDPRIRNLVPWRAPPLN